jgi:hypothetical protein
VDFFGCNDWINRLRIDNFPVCVGVLDVLVSGVLEELVQILDVERLGNADL